MHLGLAVVALCSSTVLFTPQVAGASNISRERAAAALLYSQIQRTNSRVGLLSQKYDQALVKLQQFNHQIKNTKNVVALIERGLAHNQNQLRRDAVFAYVTNGSATNNNPLFTKSAAKTGAVNLYNQLAEGNVTTTLAKLKNYKVRLTQERWILRDEDRQSMAATLAAASAFHESKVLQASLQQTLGQVKGQISNFIAQQVAAAAAASAAALAAAAHAVSAKPVTGAPVAGTPVTGTPVTLPGTGLPAPPPDSRAAIAVKTALTFLGVPYVWGGASRSGVDCSGLIMLAYEAAGISFPHYSGAQFADSTPVPLSDLQPGDLLFYGFNGDEHVAMYIGNGQMVEAPYAGAVVHVTPIRLGYGFTGAGRPRG